MFKNLLNKDIFDVIEHQIHKNVTKDNMKKSFEALKQKIMNNDVPKDTNISLFERIEDKIYVFTPGFLKNELTVTFIDNTISINNMINNTLYCSITLSENDKVDVVKFNDDCLVIELNRYKTEIKIDIN
jgi:hypothetical protein